MSIQIRPARPGDIELLKDALYITVVWRDVDPPPIETVVDIPELRMYWEGWGRPGDLGVIAERDGEYVGAAFGRLFTTDRPSYGFVDEATPEVGIGIVAEERGKGLGKRMMLELEELYRKLGSKHVSLSTNLDNPARHLFESLGFAEIDRDDNSARMIKTL